MVEKNTEMINTTKGRTLVCGDIHGSLKALIQVLHKSKYDADKDRLIFIGDYVDGWSESAEVVDFIIGLQEKCKFNMNLNGVICIRGNHDVWCSNYLNKGVAPNIWRMQGGQTTIDSYVRTGLLVNEEHRKFFRSLHNYYVDENNRAFVHGGYISPKGLGHEKYQADYYWDRDLWQRHALPGKNNTDLPKLLRPHKEIFIGHTTTTNWNTTKPMNACNVWNIDTGAGWEGVLTIMDVESKEYWQSDHSKDLYPNDKGR